MDVWKRMTFWKQVGSELGIHKSVYEDESSYIHRVVLSALSDWTLLSVFQQESGISVSGLKQIIRQKYLDFSKVMERDCYPEADMVEKYVYNTLLENGAFYHRQYNVLPSRHKYIGTTQAAIVRGLQMDEKVRFSGLAPYTFSQQEVSDMEAEFDLWPYDGETTIAMIWKRSREVEADTHFDEYLNLKRTSGQYYIPKRNSSFPFGMARTRHEGDPYSSDYYMILDNEVRRLPGEVVDASLHDYLRLAFMNRYRHQVVNFRMDKHAVSVQFQYRIPAPDLRFVQYIAWPGDINDLNNAFHFMISPDLWPLLRNRLEKLDYEVKEKND